MGTFITERGPSVRLIASELTWIEGEALRQLDDTASLPGMRAAAGMPDLHPGKGSPVGAAFLSEGNVHPTLVGTDIGCGMGLWSTGLLARKAKPDRLAEQMDGLDQPWDGDAAAFLEARGIAPSAHDGGLGSPGFGNHFLELLRVAEVRDPSAFASLGLDAARLCLLVHSGSRGLGEATLRHVTERHAAAPLAIGTPEADAYLAAHDRAVRWAEANRELCARRACEAVGTEAVRALDVCHNMVEAVDVGGCRCWLHRKGAAPADRGPVVVPGSRGDVTFVVRPLPAAADLSLSSLAHGAGRKLARHQAKDKLRGLLRREDLARNPFGGRVVCGDEHLLWEEAAPAYKDIASVVGDLLGAGLCEVVAVLEPVVTFKTSAGAREERRASRRGWETDRRRARAAKHGRGHG